MSTMRGILRPLPPAAPEPEDEQVAPFRERIAARCEEHAAMYPRAVTLEARILAALHQALVGNVTAMRGIHSARRFTEVVLGEKHLRLSDLARLACEPTREPRAAVKAAVQELAAALGYRLEPMEGRTVDAFDAVSGLVSTHAALTAEAISALSDGRITAEEARALRPDVEAHKTQLAQLEAVLNGAEKGGTE